MKKCPKCLLEKDESLFSKAKKEKDGLFHSCKACQKIYRDNYNKINAEKHSLYMKEHYVTKKDQYAAYREKHRERQRGYSLKRNYGISLAQYDAMLEAQDGRCFICSCKPRSKRLAVDHNHKTKEVRGLLCSRCNKALGVFHDKAEIVERALNYLTNPPARGVLNDLQ